MPGGIGGTPKTIEAFSREIINEFGQSLANMQMTDLGKWFSLLTQDYSVLKEVDVVPYLQPTTRAQWGNIGTPIQTGDVKLEYAQIQLKKISDSIVLRKNDFEDPTVRANLMAQVQTKVGALNNELWYRFCEMLQNGDSDAFWTMQDSKLLFANDHSLFGQTVDNLLAGNLDPDDPTGFENALNYFYTIPWTGGRYLNVDGMKFYLIIPTQLRYRAKELIRNQQVWRSNIVSENPYANEVEIISTSALTNADNWYIVGVMDSMRPVTHVRHAKFGNWDIQAKISPNDDCVMQRDQYEWYMAAQRAIWPTGYFFIVKSIGGQS